MHPSQHTYATRVPGAVTDVHLQGKSDTHRSWLPAKSKHDQVAWLKWGGGKWKCDAGVIKNALGLGDSAQGLHHRPITINLSSFGLRRYAPLERQDLAAPQPPLAQFFQLPHGQFSQLLPADQLRPRSTAHQPLHKLSYPDYWLCMAGQEVGAGGCRETPTHQLNYVCQHSLQGVTAGAECYSRARNHKWAGDNSRAKGYSRAMSRGVDQGEGLQHSCET